MTPRKPGAVRGRPRTTGRGDGPVLYLRVSHAEYDDVTAIAGKGKQSAWALAAVLRAVKSAKRKARK